MRAGYVSVTVVARRLPEEQVFLLAIQVLVDVQNSHMDDPISQSIIRGRICYSGAITRKQQALDITEVEIFMYVKGGANHLRPFSLTWDLGHQALQSIG